MYKLLSSRNRRRTSVQTIPPTRKVESLEDRRMMAVDLGAVVPNLNFESYSSLPTWVSGMSYEGQTVNEWRQFTGGTSDYFHADGFLGEFTEIGVAPLPPNGSDGFIGLRGDAYYPWVFPNEYFEYAINVLPTPLSASADYIFDLFVGTPPGDGTFGGAFEGEVVVFGIEDLSDVEDNYYPAGRYDQIDLFATELWSAPVDLAASQWDVIRNVTLSPTTSIEAIVIGIRTEQNERYLLIDAAPVAPRVTQVTISGPNSVDGNNSPADGSYDIPSGSGDQIRTVPIGGANEVSIQFNKDVTVSSGDLTLKMLTSGTVPSVTFTAPTSLNDYTATWSYSTPLASGQYLLSLSDVVVDSFGQALDGEWVNPFSVSTTNGLVSEYPSGDGYTGGDFNFVFTILQGDANQNNVVEGSDFLIYQVSFNQSGLGFDGADYNGDGVTNSTDNTIWNANFGKVLTDLIFADFDNNGVVNTDDFNILAANYNMLGDFEDGDVNGDGTVNFADFSILSYQFNWELDWVA